MFKWIAENAATIICALVLAGMVAAAVTALVKNKRSGKTSCGCGCANCPMAGKCHKN